MKKISTLILGLVLLNFMVGCITLESDDSKPETQQKTFYPDYKETNTQQENLLQFTKWLESLHLKREFSGVVLYAEKGEIKYQQCLGTADIQQQIPLSLDSSFNLASVSKQFTATAIMLLKQQGKIEYDQTVQTYLTEFPYATITVRQLLNHTSGLADYVSAADEDMFVQVDHIWDLSKTYTNDDMLAFLSKQKPELKFEPGKRFDYSNTGYVTLSQ